MPPVCAPDPAAEYRAFDALWLDKGAQVQAVLDEQAADGAHVCLVQHPDDLARDSLTLRSHLTDSGVVCREAGRLFTHDRPLCLVLDCRSLSGAALASYNDLLDPDGPRLYDRITGQRRPLGSHVRLLVLLSKHQAGSDGKTDDLPGTDFWRRVSRPGLTWERPDQNAQDKNANSELPPLAGDQPPAGQDPVEVIDFALQGDWRRTLYGRPAVDNQGRIRHCPGALEPLRTRPAGTRILLRGADWSDPVFCHEWRKIQDSGVFESNGRLQRLPDGLHFLRSELDEADRLQLGGCIARQSQPSPGALVINAHNLPHWLAQGCVMPDGRWQQADPLLERLAAGADLIISSPLDEADWLRLLGRLREAGRGEGAIGVFLAYEAQKDPAVVPQLAQSCPAVCPMEDNAAPALRISPRIDIRYWRDADQIAAFMSEQAQEDDTQKPLEIRVHPGTRLGALFDNLHVLSDQRPLFGLEQTALEQALVSGRPVVLRGLETHPALQWQLESLLCDPPSLLLHGRERLFPRARLTVLWPDDCASPSPLWRQRLAAARPLPAVDIWEAVCRRWHIDAAQGKPLRRVLDAFLAAWQSVPAALVARSGPAPVLTAGLLDKLVAAAQQRARTEGCHLLAPHHWRRALDSVLSHRTRDRPAVRHFLKAVSARLLPDPGAGQWVDPGQLAALLTEQGQPNLLDEAFFTAQLWPLLRALGPELWPDLPLTFEARCRPRDLKILVAVLKVWGPCYCQHLPVPECLEPDEALLQQVRRLPVRSRAGAKRLEDALAAGWRWRGPQDGGPQTLYLALVQLAGAGYDLAGGGARCLGPLQGKLERVLEWTGAPERKDAAFRALAQDLLYERMDQADREQRRMARLRARLEQSPLVMIEGRTATGKSHFAARVAREAGTAFVISLGPSTTEDDLVQRWVWQEQGSERTMVACDQAILQWAGTRPEADKRLVTLVIDEANLAEEGVLDCLKGLHAPDPCVYVRGEAVALSRWHRVILTCNPVSYSGRREDPELSREAALVHYPPLDDDFLREQVVRPALERHLARWIEPVLLKETATRLLQLWRASQPLLPQREFTPRDLVDLCAWLGCYALKAREQGGDVSPAGLNTRLLQALRDLLEGECDSQARFGLQALEFFYGARWPQDGSPGAACTTHSSHLDLAFVRHAARVAPDFDTTPPAVMALASAVNRDLERCQLAARGKLASGRRQATLIEGPSGRGKDAALQLLLDSWKQQCHQNGEPVPVVNSLSATDCPWEALRQAFHQARSQGQVLVVSELNLFDSACLEGELNAALAGEAAPGFHLFATINPPAPGFRGRHSLSPALLGRFRRLILPDYSRQELRSIAGQALASAGCHKETLADQLTDWHSQLCQLMDRKGLAPRPVSQDLVQLALACSRSPAQDPGALFDSHYRMHLVIADLDRTDLRTPVAENGGSDATPDRTLTEWVNGCGWSTEPVTVWRGSGNHCDQAGRLVVDSTLTDSEARERLQSQVLQARWVRETGLPETPPTAPWLEGFLYRLWQQHWCLSLLSPQEAETARRIFPLSPAQQLALPANRSRVQALHNLCLPWPKQAWQWQKRWRRIQKMSRQPLTAATAGRKSGSHALPPAQASTRLAPFADAAGVEKASWVLDRTTDEMNAPPPVYVPLGTFGPGCEDSLLRLAVFDPVLKGSDLLVCPRTPGRMGFEPVVPGRMQPDERPCLGRDQCYGIHRLEDNTSWQPLPGRHPDERLLLVRCCPPRDLAVLRDCETGLHYLQLTGDAPQTDKPVEVHYVLETPASQAPAESGRRGEPHPDALCDTRVCAQLDAALASARKNCSSQATARTLDAILTASSSEERMEAIARFCASFGCNRAPAQGESLLEFLLRERQGSCRHRACLQVLLCRRWGIAARLVRGHHHLFVECSLNQGLSWERRNPGGTPMRRQPLPEAICQAHAAAYREGQTVEEASVQRFFQSLDGNERAFLAQILEVDPGLIDQVAVTGVLPRAEQKRLLGERSLLLYLFSSDNIHCFLLGCRLLRASDTPSAVVKKELGDPHSGYSFPGDVAVRFCQRSLAEQMQVRKALESLRDWAIRHQLQAHWNCLLLKLLERLIPQFALASSRPAGLAEQMVEWLLQHEGCIRISAQYRIGDEEMRQTLQHMTRVNFCTRLASLQLESWYRSWLALPGDQAVPQPRLAPAGATHFANWQPSCYGGRLPSLEKLLSARTTGTVWTDQPDGLPDLERLLNQLPAFATRRAVISRTTKVLVLGGLPQTDAPLRARLPGLLRHLVDNPGDTHRQAHCQTLLRWAFCQCLYQTVSQHAGQLSTQTSYDRPRGEQFYRVSGVQTAGSAARLTKALLGGLADDQAPQVFRTCQLDLVRAAWGEPEGLVLDGDLLASLMREFFQTMDQEQVLQALVHSGAFRAEDTTGHSP